MCPSFCALHWSFLISPWNPLRGVSLKIGNQQLEAITMKLFPTNVTLGGIPHGWTSMPRERWWKLNQENKEGRIFQDRYPSWWLSFLWWVENLNTQTYTHTQRVFSWIWNNIWLFRLKIIEVVLQNSACLRNFRHIPCCVPLVRRTPGWDR